MPEEILGEGNAPEESSEEAVGATALTGNDEASEDAGTNNADNDAAGGDADGTTDEKGEDSPADKPSDGAPEAYEMFKMPEGMTLNEEAAEAFSGVAKELNLTQDQAQRLVDIQSAQVNTFSQAQEQAKADQQAEWSKSSQTDAEYGKGKYDASLNTARAAMREVGTPELVSALDETGMGDHPEFIRFFYRVGKAIGEDNFDFGNNGGDTKKSQADRIFANQGK